mgnify:CR=1 FL=1
MSTENGGQNKPVFYLETCTDLLFFDTFLIALIPFTLGGFSGIM